MSVVQTALVFVGIPLGLFAVFAILTLGPGAAKAPRYRPGGRWQYEAVWYLPHPAHAEPISTLQAAGALEAGSRLAVHGEIANPIQASGGASGDW